MGEIVFDQVALEGFLRDANEKAVGGATQEIMDVALRITPYRTGYMHDQHKIIKVSDKEYLLFVDTHYSMLVHDGHRIVSRDGRTVGYKEGDRWLVRSVDIVAARHATEV